MSISPADNHSSKSITLLLDTNVWIDNFFEGRPKSKEARALITTAIKQNIPLFYSAGTIKDFYYLVSLQLKRDISNALSETNAKAISEISWKLLDTLHELGTAVGLDESDIWLAKKYRSIHGDFEDNLIIAAAQRANVTYLVTNDKKLILHAPIAALTPKAVIELINDQQKCTLS